MRLHNIFIIIIVFVLSSGVFATSLNGRFVIVKSDSAKLSLLLQVNTDTGTDDMGGATIVVSFNKSVLDFSSNPAVNSDYKFHNFSGGKYNEATVTKPLSDKLWINIDLPSDNDNKGTIVSGLSGWTDVVTLNFNVKNSVNPATVNWSDGNVFWQVYDGDNSTNWSAGNFTNFTNFTNSPASVELLSFTAVLLDNSNIQLDWSTISYADNDSYEIERTTSPRPSPYQGEGDGNAWQKIGVVESKNILNTQVNYSFVDNTAGSGTSLKYRLKSVSSDATTTILSEVDIVISPDNFELEQNFPNPFNPVTKIRYTIPPPSNGKSQTSNVLLKVYDILGNEAATLVNETQESGQHEVEFNASNLASGVYIYRIETASFHDTKKMILLK